MEENLTLCTYEAPDAGREPECVTSGRLSKAELSETVRGKILKYLSSGKILALAIFNTLGSVMYALTAVGLVLMTVLLAFVREGFTASGIATYIVLTASYVFLSVYLAVTAKALYKIRSSARRDSVGVAQALTSLAGVTSAYRVFYYISAAINAVLLIWGLGVTAVSSNPVYGEASEAYNIGYTSGYIIGTAMTSVFALVVGVVLAHLFCSSLIKLFNRIKERLAAPLVPGPTKHRLPAVISFISAGYMVLSVGFVMFMFALLGVAVFALIGSGAIDMAGAPSGAFGAAWVIAFVLMAVMITALVAPIVAYNILLGVTVLKYNKLEKEISALVADNSEEIACTEQALPIE